MFTLSRPADMVAVTLLESQIIKYVKNLSHRRCILSHLSFKKYALTVPRLRHWTVPQGKTKDELGSSLALRKF